MGNDVHCSIIIRMNPTRITEEALNAVRVFSNQGIRPSLESVMRLVELRIEEPARQILMYCLSAWSEVIREIRPKLNVEHIYGPAGESPVGFISETIVINSVGFAKTKEIFKLFSFISNLAVELYLQHRKLEKSDEY